MYTILRSKIHMNYYNGINLQITFQGGWEVVKPKLFKIVNKI